MDVIALCFTLLLAATNAMALSKDDLKQIEPILHEAVERARTDATYGKVEPDLRPRLPNTWQVSEDEGTRIKYWAPLIVNEQFRVYAYIVVRKDGESWKAEPPYTTTMHARRK